MAKVRDAVGGPNLTDGLALIPAIVYVIYAIVCCLWVVIYLAIVKLKVQDGTALTWAQARIIMLVTVMCSLYLAIFIFRAQIEWKWAKPMGESITQWLFCTLTTPGPQDTIVATCGEVASYRIPSAWFDYLAYISGSPGFTIFFAVGFSWDVMYCWAKFVYGYTNWEWLRVYSKKAPRAATDKTHQFEMTRTGAPDSKGGGSKNGGSKVGSKAGGSRMSQSQPTVAPSNLFKKVAARPTGNSVVVRSPRGESPRGDSMSVDRNSNSTGSTGSTDRPSDQSLFHSQGGASPSMGPNNNDVEMSNMAGIREESVSYLGDLNQDGDRTSNMSNISNATDPTPSPRQKKQVRISDAETDESDLE